MWLYLARNGQQSGPHTEEDVRAMVNAGEVSRGLLAWREGLGEWAPLEHVVSLDSDSPSNVVGGLPSVPPGHSTIKVEAPKMHLLERLAEHWETGLGAVLVISWAIKHPEMIGLALIAGIPALFLCWLIAKVARAAKPKRDAEKPAPTISEVANFDVGKITVIVIGSLLLVAALTLLWLMHSS